MNNKYKTIGILLLTGFSFFYTYKVSSFIKDNDPIMTRINNIEDTLIVSKIDPIINDDEYITGINRCIVNKEESYSKMKVIRVIDKFKANILLFAFFVV